MLVRKEEPVSALEEFYTTRELAQLLGITERAVQLRAKREGWLFVQKRGRGGGKRWGASSTPKETRELIASGLLRQQYATQEADSCAINACVACAMAPTARTLCCWMTWKITKTYASPNSATSWSPGCCARCCLLARLMTAWT
nr:DNA-binding protein [Desulfovibrio sp.]